MVTLASSLAACIANDYPRLLMGSLGINLKRARGSRKQKDIAAELGMKQTELSNYEHDRYATITLDKLLVLARGYRCSVEELVVGIDSAYDLSRHEQRLQGTLRTGGALDSIATRLQQEVGWLRQALNEVGRTAKAAITLTDEFSGDEGRTAAAHQADRGVRRGARHR